jgi:hypothetical protein
MHEITVLPASFSIIEKYLPLLITRKYPSWHKPYIPREHLCNSSLNAELIFIFDICNSTIARKM